ncbi:MAG: glycosyltransferase family 4 protein [Anaerolineae bacterium]
MKVLYVVHQYLPRHLAGTEIYTHALARAVGRVHGVRIYCGEPAMDGGTVATLDEVCEGVAVHRVAAYVGARRQTPWATFDRGYRNPAIENDFVKVLDDYRPDVVHVQHLKGLSVGALGRVAERGIPLVMTLHDYWAICPNAQRVRPGGVVCERVHAHLECAGCAAERIGRPALRWAAPLLAPMFGAYARHVRSQMRQVARFIAPSTFLRDRYVDAGYPPERFLQWENGLDLGRLAGGIGAPREGFQGRVAFIGSLAWQKGVHVLVDAFRRLARDGATLRIWGNPATFPEYSASLSRAAQGFPGIHMEGALEHNRVGEALAWADVLVVPSLWWENSPVTIQEAYACGVPVIASRLGALAEKVRHEHTGLLFTPGDADDLAHALERLWRDPELWQRLRVGIRPPQDIGAHAETMLALYDELVSRRRPTNVAD